MAAKAESKTETRKEWVAPELKKVSIEEITSAPSGKNYSGNDGNGNGGSGRSNHMS